MRNINWKLYYVDDFFPYVAGIQPTFLSNMSNFLKNDEIQIMYHWCSENIGPRCYGLISPIRELAMWRYTNDKFFFKREQDRLLFVLMFSGSL